MQIKQGDIGFQRAHTLDAFKPVTGLANHFEIVIALEQRLDATTEQCMVVDQQHPDFFAHFRHSPCFLLAGSW
jgi:hypothetical protein